MTLQKSMGGILLLSSVFASADICEDWFKNTHLNQISKEDCLLQCVSAPKNPETIGCPHLCPKFCKVGIKPRFIFRSLVFYPGLTQAERALTAYYPKKMWQAYRLSWRAEKICLSLFKKSGSHDVSDACRHFMWFALLLKPLGKKLSLSLSKAHESDPRQTSAERAMDIANDRLGIITAERLLNQVNLTEKSLIKAFQNLLKKGQVTVLVGSKKP